MKNITSDRYEYPDQVYDLAVIGAGPAGSLAAALAAKAGLSVIMLEQKKHPRPKICGGFLSSRAISILPQDLELLSIQSQPVCQISVIKKGTSHTYNSKNRLGLLIKRDELDHLMARYAVEAGAKLKESDTLKVLHNIKPDGLNNGLYSLVTANNKYFANFIIIADGACSKNIDKAGLTGKYNFCGWALSKTINKRSSPAAETGTLKFYPLPLIGGMGWYFNGQGWTNQGVGGLTGKRILKRVYRKLFSSDTDEDREQDNLKIWPLPFLGPLKKNASHNAIAIGDASGLVEPFSGEGLYNSFKSAHLAVSAIIIAITNINNPAIVEEIYNPLFRKYFFCNFIKTLPGAALLHTRSILASSTLPFHIATLMNNSLWFNQALDLSLIRTGRLLFKDIGD